MAVREFNGSGDFLRLSVGGLSAATHGTYAAIFKVDNTAAVRTLFCFLSSGSGFLGTPLQVDTDDTAIWFTAGGSKTSGAIPQGVWLTLVVRKATGTATPRFSYFNHDTLAWTHGNGTAAIANSTAPTSGFINTATDGSSAEPFDGRIAVTAGWSNAVHWTADASGDTTIEAAGLELTLDNWVAETPDGLWVWNPSVAAGITDLAGNGANQAAISGTTQVLGDDPPGFDFGPQPITYKSQGAGAGTETNGAALNLACPAIVDADDILIAHIVKLDITTTPTEPADWDLLYGPANLGTGTAVARAWVYGKYAVGDEDGDTISFGTTGGTAGRFGRIYSFDGAESGLTLADVVPAASFSDTPSEDDPPGPSVTTTVEGALAIALIAQDDNNALAAFGAVTGGTWTEPVAEFVDTAIGAQGCVCQIQTATPTANPGTISGGTLTTAADEGSSIGFEIRPTTPGTDLVVADAAQGQTTETPTLTQTHVLTVADAAQGQTTETPALTQLHVLTVADAVQGQTLESPTLEVIVQLVVADAAQGQTTETPTLTQLHVLTVADAVQGQTLETPTLTQTHVLTVADAAQGQTLETPTLEVVEAEGLPAKPLIIVGEAIRRARALRRQSFTTFVDLGAPLLIEEEDNTLTVADAAQGQTLETPTLTQVHNLTVDDVLQAQATETPSLTQTHVLTIADAAQGQTLETPTLVVGGVNLVVQDAAQGQTLESPAPTQTHQLTVADAAQQQIIDGLLALSQTHVLTVADVLQAQSIDHVTFAGTEIPSGVVRITIRSGVLV